MINNRTTAGCRWMTAKCWGHGSHSRTVHSAFQIVRAMGYQGANGFDVADGHGCTELQNVLVRTRNPSLGKLSLPLERRVIPPFHGQPLVLRRQRPFLMEIAMKRVLLLVLGSLLLALPVSASQYYVSPDGNDNNSGTSPSSPWATLSKVNNFVFNGGDTVSFQGGQTFTGCLVFNSSTVQHSSASTPFTVNSYGAGMATIQSGCTGNTSAAVIADNVNGFYLNGLKIVNG